MDSKNQKKEIKHAKVLKPGEGEIIKAGANKLTLKVTSDDSPKLSLIEYHVAPRFSAPPILHHHTREDWVAYVTEGEVTFVLSDQEVRAVRGTTVFVPLGVDFAWRNDQDEPAVYLAIHAPGGFDKFFVDVADAVKENGGLPTPEIMKKVIPPLWAKYGIEPDTKQTL